MNGLNATLLATSGMVESTIKNFTYDASGYKAILAVAHNGGNPTTSTWIGQAVVPINIEDVHTAQIALTNMNSAMDVRVWVRKTSCDYMLAGSTSLSPHVSIYGLK